MGQRRHCPTMLSPCVMLLAPAALAAAPYEIARRPNTGAFTISRMNPKAAAAAIVQAIAGSGSAVIAIPRV